MYGEVKGSATYAHEFQYCQQPLRSGDHVLEMSGVKPITRYAALHGETFVLNTGMRTYWASTTFQHRPLSFCDVEHLNYLMQRTS